MVSTSKLAVVTGGSTGIGKDISLLLAESGWNIAISNIHADENTEEVVDEIKSTGRDCFFYACDVGVKQEVEKFYRAIEENFGDAPDLLVNNAGVQTWAPLLDLKEADWDRVVRTNLKGCFLNTQIVANLMKKAKKPGSIVNIGSGCNKLAFPNLVDYSASKGGVEMFTKVAAVELGGMGIRVNCVAPGGILTNRTQEESSDYAGDWAKITPLGRVGYAKDIANAVIFLAGDQSSFITGQTIWVDGGAFTKANWPYA